MLRGLNQLDYPYFPFRLSVDYVLVSKTDDLSRQYHRTLFEKACLREGLLVHHEYAGPVCFTLISTPFHRLCKEAERTGLSFPLKDCPVNPAEPTCCTFLSTVFVSEDEVNYISAPFQRKYAHLFVDYGNEKLFFTSAQKDQLTQQILSEIDNSRSLEEAPDIKNSRESSAPIISDGPLQRRGLDYLLMEETYEDVFILHDPSEEEPYFKKMKDNSMMNYLEMVSEIEEDPRKKLSHTWHRFHKTQPISSIRRYFGEQIAFYFAWEGTFLTLLWPAAILGLGVFVFGIVKSVRLHPVQLNNCTIINYEGKETYVPCQLRDGASKLFSTLSSWLMKAFDNELNAFYAAFMSIWGSLFYQIWRRNNSVLAYEWDCEDFQQTEPDRPQYQGSEMREDPITGETEWLSPQLTRYFKMFLSALLVLLSMCVVVISVLCVTIYKIWIVNLEDCNKEYTLKCSLLAVYVPSIANTVSTMILGFIYQKIVEKLNNWENHRTQSEHNNSLIIKLFAFQLVNNYTSLFYLAFVRPERHGFQQNGLFGLGPSFRDICRDGTCGSLLAVQLLSHMAVKPLPKFSKDIVLPLFVSIYRRARWRGEAEETTMHEVLRESDETNVLIREWLKPSAGDFALWEFNEKIILFGTTMMFASLFPLAPLIALVIGLIDLRIDAHRLVWFNRRPVAVTVTGIGIWLPILFFLQYAAVMTNAFIIAFTSDFCTDFFGDDVCDVKNRLVIVIVFQNMVFILKYAIQSVIPTVPASITVAQRRKRYIIAHIIEKGDVPYKIKNKKRARRAKLAWITSRSNAIRDDAIRKKVRKSIANTDKKAPEGPVPEAAVPDGASKEDIPVHTV